MFHGFGGAGFATLLIIIGFSTAVLPSALAENVALDGLDEDERFFVVMDLGGLSLEDAGRARVAKNPMAEEAFAHLSEVVDRFSAYHPGVDTSWFKSAFWTYLGKVPSIQSEVDHDARIAGAMRLFDHALREMERSTSDSDRRSWERRAYAVLIYALGVVSLTPNGRRPAESLSVKLLSVGSWVLAGVSAAISVLSVGLDNPQPVAVAGAIGLVTSLAMALTAKERLLGPRLWGLKRNLKHWLETCPIDAKSCIGIFANKLFGPREEELCEAWMVGPLG